MEKTRNDIIHEKGFSMNTYQDYSAVNETEFKRIKVGVKQIDDATIKLGDINKCMPNHMFTNKKYILRALGENNL